MVEITMQVSNSLATRIQSLGDWSSTIIELKLVDFKFKSTIEASTKLIDLLSQNPSPQKVLDYFISDKHQKRLNELLEMNREGKTTENHQSEMDEWEKLEHIAIMMKAKAGKLLKGKL